MSPVNEEEEEEKKISHGINNHHHRGALLKPNQEILELEQDNSYEDFEDLQINDEGIKEQNLNHYQKYFRKNHNQELFNMNKNKGQLLEMPKFNTDMGRKYNQKWALKG